MKESEKFNKEAGEKVLKILEEAEEWEYNMPSQEELKKEWLEYVRNSFPEPIPDDEKLLAASVDYKDAQEWWLSKLDTHTTAIRNEIREKIEELKRRNISADVAGRNIYLDEVLAALNEK